MHSLMVRFAHFCVEKQIIESKHFDWFVYGLEKRLSTIILSIPFVILAIVVSNLPCAISFFLSFFVLREYIGGFHANTVWGCLIISLLSEAALFFLVHPFLSPIAIVCITIVSITCIYILSPYNHPNMHLTDKEIAACRKKGRIRAFVVSSVIAFTCILGQDEIAKGLTLGIALTTAMLCLGYIYDRRISK